MDNAILGEYLGYLAGGIILYSSWPMIKEELWTQKIRSPGERLCRLWLAIGNSVWVASGILTGNSAVMIVCGVNCAIQFGLWIRMTTRALLNTRPQAHKS